MSDEALGTSQKQLFKEENMTLRDHIDPDKHWIGESLPSPTQTEIAATVGTVSGPGDSPFVARADHTHKLDAGIFPVYTGVFPSAAEDATTSSSFVTWLTCSSFTIPSWAITAFMQMNITNVVSTTASSVYALDATISTTPGGYTFDYGAISFEAANERRSVSFCRTVSGFATGTQDLRIGARRASGGGILRADASSKITCFVWFKP